jgi:hypothetical protein
MTTPNPDNLLNELVRKSIVSKGLRPTEADDIDAMLDAVGGEIPSDTLVYQLLRKIRGEDPIGIHEEILSETELLPIDEAIIPDEALALYRNQNDCIPPEIEKMLKEMEKRALKKDKTQDKGDTDA